MSAPAKIGLQPVESSQIHSIGHDASTNTLAIRFKNKAGGPGSLYHYSNFNAEQFAAFQGAESVGSHFYKHIKHKADVHPYIRVNEAEDAQQGD